MTKLAHQVLEDDRVLVSLVGQSASLHVSASEAKRFAWAILAELEPDEVKRTKRRSRRKTPDEERIRQVLWCLRDCKPTAIEISAACECTYAAVNACLARMERGGLAFKASAPVPGQLGGGARWGITAAGRARLETLTRAPRKFRPPPITKSMEQVLCVLADGPAPLSHIATKTDACRQMADQRLRSLAKRGLVAVVVKGKRGSPSIWELTPSGYAEIGARPPEARAA